MLLFKICKRPKDRTTFIPLKTIPTWLNQGLLQRIRLILRCVALSPQERLFIIVFTVELCPILQLPGEGVSPHFLVVPTLILRKLQFQPKIAPRLSLVVSLKCCG